MASGVTELGIRRALGRSDLALEAAMMGVDGSPEVLALVLEAFLEGSEQERDFIDLVLSGPEVPGVPTSDTAAVMRAMIETAERRILLVGYAVHNGKKLFARLAEKMEADSELEVTMCLDIARRRDTSLDEEVVRRFSRTFADLHWPRESRRPQIYYDPRSLNGGSSLHAKCVVVDGREALISSANFTEAAQRRNIEAGVLVRDAGLVRRVEDYFTGLIAGDGLRRVAGW